MPLLSGSPGCLLDGATCPSPQCVRRGPKGQGANASRADASRAGHESSPYRASIRSRASQGLPESLSSLSSE